MAAGVELGGLGRLVVKVGSSLLIHADGGLNRAWLHTLIADIAALRERGCDVIVVSSGAVALGASLLGVNRRRARLPQLQAAAAAGQVSLVNAYEAGLSDFGIATAQVLLTRSDTENRRRFLNARATLSELLARRIVPIVNENDTVSTDEIRYGDNDRLAARVAQLVMADALILLSDVDGLYESDPRGDPDAVHIADVTRIDGRIRDMAGETRTDTGSGGMATKVEAAQIATHAGCQTIVTLGSRPHPLEALADGVRHTVFRSEGTPAARRKQWLAGSLDVAGTLVIDAGAADALRDGGSLLPVGVVSLNGEFRRGDVVSITTGGGRELGRGLAEYGHAEAEKLLGARSDDIERRLGYRGRPVLVHRDELVLFGND